MHPLKDVHENPSSDPSDASTVTEPHAPVAELADAQDLGSCVFGRVGSSPTWRTNHLCARLAVMDRGITQERKLLDPETS